MIKIHKYLKQRGLYPAIQIMDNECPALLKRYFTKKKEFQLVLPNLHQNNMAEKAIGTFKDHLITILCSCDPYFPMHMWCRLIRQATTTLNLLRQSRINPRLSAEAQLNGASVFNAAPLAPPETKAVIYEKPRKMKDVVPTRCGWVVSGFGAGALSMSHRVRDENQGRAYRPHRGVLPV